MRSPAALQDTTPPATLTVEDPLEFARQLGESIGQSMGQQLAGVAGTAAEAAPEGAEAIEGPAADIANVSDLEGLQALLIEWKDKLIDFLPTLGMALLILVAGWIIAKLIRGIVRRALVRADLDPTLTNFVSSCVYMLVMAFVIISAIAKLGVNTASFVAILGAASFAVGFALQGSLANFAAGVMMMIFRPIRVGDLVEAGGVLGTVKEVGVFATMIDTLENKKAIIANATITGGNIINYSANGLLRVDMTFGIGYGEDMDRAIELMESVLAADERVLKDPAPTVACVGHGDSSVDFVCRPYVRPEHYWDVWFDTHKSVKEAFDKANVSIPFPQRDVHMIPAAS